LLDFLVADPEDSLTEPPRINCFASVQEYYTVGTLYHFIQFMDLDHPQYIRKVIFYFIGSFFLIFKTKTEKFTV
jgi:hypothetical protein